MTAYLRERASLTLLDLERNTQSVLPVALDRAEVSTYKFTDENWAPQPGFKIVQSNVVSHWSESDKYYKTVIDFIGVAEGETPSYSKTPVRVSCSCAAYYFYFAKWNVDGGAHARGRMRPYVHVLAPKRKVGPLNPRRLPGCCKHQLAYAQHLIDTGKIVA